MKILLVSASPRSQSQTKRMVDYMATQVTAAGAIAEVIDLSDDQVSPYIEQVWQNTDGQGDLVSKLTEQAEAADGFVFATPEYGGMASASLKAYLTVVSGFAHKPAVIASVSAGKGGAYPVAELRMSSYKNSKVVYIPEHLIFRFAETLFDGTDAEADSLMADRTSFSINALVKYAAAMKPLASDTSMVDDRFKFGM